MIKVFNVYKFNRNQCHYVITQTHKCQPYIYFLKQVKTDLLTKTYQTNDLVERNTDADFRLHQSLYALFSKHTEQPFQPIKKHQYTDMNQISVQI